MPLTIHVNNSNSKEPIVRRSARRNATKKRLQHLKNQQARAELYRSHAGGSNWQKDILGWHSTLKGLSMGTV